MEEKMDDNTKKSSAKFNTSIEEKDLMDFKIYHNYHSFSGIVNLISMGIILPFVISCVIISLPGVKLNSAGYPLI